MNKMVGRTDDKDFIVRRTQQLLMETVACSAKWVRESDRKVSTSYNVVIPEDGEDYSVRMSLMKFGSNGDTRYLLVSHETGILGLRHYKLRSADCSFVSQLGNLVFSK